MLPRGDYLAFLGGIFGNTILTSIPPKVRSEAPKSKKAPMSSKLDALPKRSRLGNKRRDGCIDYEEMRED
jgi:hypothetical protein